MEFKALIERDEDGYYVATVPALPGCISQGRTEMEANQNIKEAIELHRSQIDCATRRLHDHERIERRDAVVTTDVGCDPECDRGVCGGDLVVAARGRLFVACRQRHVSRFGELIMTSSAVLSKAVYPRQPMIALLSYENV